ncbi:MAG TPA: aminotransferase class I/II-fold pyridoxal phosphate-dependent enzyme [Anaerolineales bacterium]|nr:aminotransferase class I/II-fold pyridoxal phosphate-dependent enzyme [Anaerolineales bacterium]HLB49157.1 aminotransferase class I/II-fold pyridoxal phosphate-dependent enzyme [Anaerolineales bacterium]
MDIESLIRPEIITMERYIPIVPFEVLTARLGRAPSEIIKLDANENPYGPSPKALAALANLQFSHIYPDPASTALRAALSRDLGLPAENILAGAGADELIDLIMRLFIRPGDIVIDCPPTFGMYSFDTAINAGTLIQIPRRDDFDIDVPAIESIVRGEHVGADLRVGLVRGEHTGSPPPKILFIASPNNPDGSLISDADLRRLLALPLVIVLDEAYIEFSGTLGHARWVLEHDNLIVLRTFSKRGGLAGLRVGYGIFPSALMPHLWKIKQPYNVSVAASAAAIASLEDADYMADVVKKLVAERNRMAEALSELPFIKVYPSHSNFVLCRVIGRDAKELKLKLEQQGILVRYFNKPGLADCIRISAGKPEQTDALLSALRRLA